MLIAHAGHWAISLAYFAPVVGFLAWLAVVQLRDRRAERRGENVTGEGKDEPPARGRS